MKPGPMMKVKRSNLRRLIYLTLKVDGPMTLQELSDVVRRTYPFQSDRGIRNRCDELVKQGLVELVPSMAAAADGRLVALWRVAR